jgi:hypothetical protein
MAQIVVASWGSETEPFQLEGKASIARDESDASLARYTEDHLGFHGYMRVVNAHIRRRAIVGVMDLPDRCWWDQYGQLTCPIAAADAALFNDREVG